MSTDPERTGIHTCTSSSSFRRAVLRLFVRLELFNEEQAAGMLTWPRSGFHVHTAVSIPEDDRAVYSTHPDRNSYPA